MADAAVPVGQAHITAHDPRHVGEPDLVDKGLAHDSVGLVSSIALGLSSVAPAYALIATLGPTVTEMPAVFLLGFVPMVLVAVGCRELNRVAPDAGTSFTWTAKALGPHIGWLCGWGSSWPRPSCSLEHARQRRHVRGLRRRRPFVAYRGMTTTKAVTYVLVAVQMVVLAVFNFSAIGRALDGGTATAIDFEIAWLSPFSVESFSALAAGLSPRHGRQRVRRARRAGARLGPRHRALRRRARQLGLEPADDVSSQPPARCSR